MPPETKKLLYDMQLAASRVARFTSGKTFDDYLADDMPRSAVERQFGTVGEALTKLRQRLVDR